MKEKQKAVHKWTEKMHCGKNHADDFQLSFFSFGKFIWILSIFSSKYDFPCIFSLLPQNIVYLQNIIKGCSINSDSSLNNLKYKKEKISLSSGNRSLLIMEEIEEKKNEKIPKKNDKQKEKRYIVDNMEDIFSKISSEKLKLLIQEALLYIIVFIKEKK